MDQNLITSNHFYLVLVYRTFDQIRVRRNFDSIYISDFNLPSHSNRKDFISN